VLGGWDPETGEIHKDLDKEIDQAFKNVDLAIRTAGGKGWDQASLSDTHNIFHQEDESS
jgi:enamine deaminase RidA (YjgF/YER057c/UK114 family)